MLIPHFFPLKQAEPDSRIEKGVDVKFSIDDFEKCKVSSLFYTLGRSEVQDERFALRRFPHGKEYGMRSLLSTTRYSGVDIEGSRHVYSNHQAKNFLKSQMKLDHLCLFYASNTKVPGVTGIAKVVKEGYPDHNAWDPKHP